MNDVTWGSDNLALNNDRGTKQGSVKATGRELVRDGLSKEEMFELRLDYWEGGAL